jgi:hypothetical protein
MLTSGLGGRRRTAAALAVLSTGLVMTGTVTTPAHAAVETTSLTSESFTGSTVDDQWVLPARDSNVACLTAGTSTSSTPVPGCAGAPDAAGSGTLQLTANDNGQVGSVYNTVSLPTRQGLDISFNTFQYGQDRTETSFTEGADGISFILAAADPTDPAPPETKGALGGSLGYSSSGATPGVSYGYLGFGIDVYGNFLNSDFGGLDCPPSSRGTQNIGIRGPGNGTSGYCLLGSQQLAAASLDKQDEMDRPAAIPVEIVLNPSESTVRSSGGLLVDPHTLTLRVGTYNGSQTITTALPVLDPADYPAGYVDPESGLPYQLSFGWGASTGGSNEVHEIGELMTQTLTGKLPVYGLDVASSSVAAGAQGTVRVTPRLGAGEGGETRPVTVTTTFPEGVTPAAGTTAAGYTCLTDEQVSRCRISKDGTFPAGSSLPALDIPVTVAADASAGSYPVTAKVSSNDGRPAAASGALTVALAAPGAPTRVTAVPDESAILVSWEPPTTGQPVAKYRVTASPGQATCTTTGTSCLLGGVAGTSYTISVTPITADGLEGSAGTTTTGGAVAPPTIPSSPPADAPLTLTTTDGAITSAEPGQEITVIGTGFLPYSTATIVIYSTPITLGTVTTDGTGAFSKPVTIPTTLEAGAHSLVAYGVDPSGDTHALRLNITVAAASAGVPAAATPTATGSGLAYTGSTFNPIPAVVGGTLLMLLGVVLLVVVRARRRAGEAVSGS